MKTKKNSEDYEDYENYAGISLNEISCRVKKYSKYQYFIDNDNDNFHFEFIVGSGKVTGATRNGIEYKSQLLVDMLNVGKYLYKIRQEGKKQYENTKENSNYYAFLESDKYKKAIDKIIKLFTTYGEPLATKTSDIKDNEIEFLKKYNLDSEISISPMYEITQQLEGLYTAYLYKDKGLDNNINIKKWFLSLNVNVTVFQEYPACFDKGKRTPKSKSKLLLFAPSLIDLAKYQLAIQITTYENNTEIKNVGVCQYCKVFFYRERKNNLYCTPSHKTAYHKNPNPKKTKLCKLCNLEFEIKHQSQKYCEKCNPDKAYYIKKRKEL